MKRLCFMIPKNAVKCLLFTVLLAKPFKGLSIMGVRRYKRKKEELGRGVDDKIPQRKDRDERRWRGGKLIREANWRERSQQTKSVN